jgi:hypothetical protein
MSSGLLKTTVIRPSLVIFAILMIIEGSCFIIQIGFSFGFSTTTFFSYMKSTGLGTITFTTKIVDFVVG